MKGILSKKDAIKAAINAGVPLKHMKLVQAHDTKLDEGVLMWLKKARGQNLPVSSNLIKEVMKPAELIHILDFMVSDSWLDNFKKCHSIMFKTVQGKAGAVICNPFLSGNNRFSGPCLDNSLLTTSSIWTRLDSSGSCFQTRPWLSGESGALEERKASKGSLFWLRQT